MVKPAADTKIVVNVKGVNGAAWEHAKAAAARSGETLGQWISRAADQLATREAGDRIIPPARGANPAPAAPPPGPALGDVAALLQAMGMANVPVQKRVGRQVNALLHGELARLAPPAKPHLVEGPPAPKGPTLELEAPQ
jgi:hypothetical protein